MQPERHARTRPALPEHGFDRGSQRFEIWTHCEDRKFAAANLVAIDVSNSLSSNAISEADCVVRVQVDALADTRRIWHEQNQEDAIVLAHLVKTEGLRWFDTMHDTKARVAHLNELDDP